MNETMSIRNIAVLMKWQCLLIRRWVLIFGDVWRYVIVSVMEWSGVMESCTSEEG
jgi:ATP/ADP translocase